MIRPFRPLLIALALASTASLAQPVKVAGLVELSSPGATAGTNFSHGVKLAVREITATGGLDGRAQVIETLKPAWATK